MTDIHVPDVPAPKGLCWKQKLTPPKMMVRCTYPAGHEGLHQWEERHE